MFQNKGAILGGLAAGALLMYILDPASGSSRRSGVKNKVTGAARKSAYGLGKIDSRWHPAVRALVGAGAGYLAMRSFRRGGPVGIGLGTLGLGAATRAAINKPVRQWPVASDGRGARVGSPKPISVTTNPSAARV
jgi:hypothetical protein